MKSITFNNPQSTSTFPQEIWKDLLLESINAKTTNYKSTLLGATVYLEHKIIAFYGGIFSQWADGKFHSNLLATEVNCAEQAMMLYKAKLFKDDVAYDSILRSSSPCTQKHLGRLVENFNKKLWDKVKYDAVVSINYDKFSQLTAYRELLLLTDPYEIVEASPTDRIWGIGMSEGNPDILNRSKWGKNLLGKAIVHTRNKIIKELK